MNANAPGSPTGHRYSVTRLSFRNTSDRKGHRAPIDPEAVKLEENDNETPPNTAVIHKIAEPIGPGETKSSPVIAPPAGAPPTVRATVMVDYAGTTATKSLVAPAGKKITAVHAEGYWYRDADGNLQLKIENEAATYADID